MASGGVPRHTHAFTDIVGGQGTGGGGGGDVATERAQRIAADNKLTEDKVNRVGDDRVTGQLRVGQSKVDDQAGTGQRMVTAHDEGTQASYDDAYVVDAVGDVITGEAGIAWLRYSSAMPATRSWRGVVEGNGLLVAVAESGTGTRVATSTDGQTWTLQTASNDANWQSVAYGNGVFVAVASGGTGSRVMWSTDGITWTAGTIDVYGWFDIIYVSGTFYAVSTNGGQTRSIAKSTDGATWTYPAADANPGAFSVSRIAYGNGVFVTSTTTSGYYLRSTDGVSWFRLAAPAGTQTLNAICFGAGKFVMFRTNVATAGVYSSADGISWTTSNSPASIGFGRCIFAASRFILTSNNGGANGRWASSDGLTWTASATSFFQATALCYAPTIGMFVNIDPIVTSVDLSDDFFTPGSPGYFRFDVKVRAASLQADDCAGSNKRMLIADADGVHVSIASVVWTGSWLQISGSAPGTPTAGQVLIGGGNVAAAGTVTAASVTVAAANYVYLRGNASTDGSVRFSSPSDGTMLIEKRASGSWVSIGSFA